MLSMMSLAIQSRAIGSSDASRRKTKPKETTSGPDLHTIPRTGGTCCRAEKRSRHPLQKFPCSAVVSIGLRIGSLPLSYCKTPLESGLDALGRRRLRKPLLFVNHVECHFMCLPNFDRS